MKRLKLFEVERHTLREIVGFTSSEDASKKNSVVEPGLTLQKTTDELRVHLNIFEQWRQRWNKFGLTGLTKHVISVYQECRRPQ